MYMQSFASNVITEMDWLTSCCMTGLAVEIGLEVNSLGSSQCMHT